MFNKYYIGSESNSDWYEYPDSINNENSERDMSIEELEDYYKNL